MIGRIKRWVSKIRGPKPYMLITTADAVLRMPEPEGNGWLDPAGYFYACEDYNYRTHRELAFRILFPDAPASEYDQDRLNYERDLEQRRFVKLTESVLPWSGWHRATRPTRVQRELMAEWYTKKSRPLPDWLENLF